MLRFLVYPAILFLFASCSLQQRIYRSAKNDVLNTTALKTAHVGISVYEPATGRYWFNHQGDKYFVPASNTKIPTCYAAMKYLGDSLVGLRYGIPEEEGLRDKVVVIKPAGDPSFLHEDFKVHPVYAFLAAAAKNKRIAWYADTLNYPEGLGNGWAWNDYQAGYMAERSVLPVFGNMVNIRLNEPGRRIDTLPVRVKRPGQVFITQSRYLNEAVNGNVRFLSVRNIQEGKVRIDRALGDNYFQAANSSTLFRGRSIPFVTGGVHAAIHILKDTLGITFENLYPTSDKEVYSYECEGCDIGSIHIRTWHPVHSQPTDSLLRPMMHRSDNFFAEQSLLMVSNERLGMMDDGRIIDTLLKTDFRDLPQQPRWADGSGLSRYNLFTPQSMVAILNKMRMEFPMERIRDILPTGGEGTLRSYYQQESGFIFAKTGTLSGVVALSGFLYTKKNKLLIFSVLVNNHRASAADVRKAVETFIRGLRNAY